MVARGGARAFTLLEVLLVIVLMVTLASFVVPNLRGYADSESLVLSARDLRSLLYMTRAMAMNDGVIYRLRFDEEDRDERDLGRPAWYQPIVEKQSDPITAPYEYEQVTSPWAREPVLRKGVRAYAVVFGEPTFEERLGEEVEVDDQEERKPEDLAPVVFTPDGAAEWLTIWLTIAPEDESPYDDGFERTSLVMDGRTGQVWVQQPLDEEEVALLKSYNLAPLIRADRINQPRLTEANILRLQRRP